ncbi:MAG: peptidoglycan-associated lipoprotein Pal [Betaproteobacteria bacterium]|nr:peptidoglycan-associated lipoprotein Pal [Betaproteobacteria bacterium]
MIRILSARAAALMAALSVALLVAGCGSTQPAAEQTAAGVEDRVPGKAAGEPTTTGVTPDGVSQAALAELRDPKSILAKRSVYFDYDSFAIRDEYKPLVDAHARFLARYPTMKVLIQGNTDERGSREYNLALGQKRADAVKKALMLLGAKETQIESVSLGEEKPKDAGHDEAAWAQNRRGDLLYSGMDF